LSSNIKTVLQGLNKKELVEIANLRKISIPHNWSKSLIVELLALNVDIDNIPQTKIGPLVHGIKSDNAPIIVLNNLVKKFEDVHAVDSLNLEIMEGELFSLLGPNGAGKTTTINILNGILKPTKGTVTIAGFDVTKNIDAIKKIIGLCPQEAAVFKFLNAHENIELFGNLHSVSKKDLEERTNTLLELLGLTEASKRKAAGYSGGMLRKLNLIIALISDPKIAFLDEPTIGMDARARRKTWEFIGSLKEKKKTVILTTHYIEEAEALSDRVGIIDYGKLIELGTPTELMNRHKTKNLEEVFLKITGRRIMEGI
jgi:ABC-2 type transport system ATP-binding protein